MKLHGSLTSPYVRKARVLLEEKRIAHEFVVADPWAADTYMPTLNPLGKVPVLVLDDGAALFDSPLICEYLDGLEAPNLIPSSGAARLGVLRWQALADGIMDAASTRVLEYRRPATQQSPETIARQEDKIGRALAYAERAHGGSRYLVEDRITLADIALGVALDYIDFRYAHPWRARHPQLSTWLAGIGARPAFAATAPPGLTRPAGAR